VKGLEAFSLQGKTALVVGGSRGIGRAIALQLARSEARVLVNHVRDMNAAQELQTLAAAESLAIELVRADVSLVTKYFLVA
jgi:3-oxoacyl-[acyl-carrier protein] reductase